MLLPVKFQLHTIKKSPCFRDHYDKNKYLNGAIRDNYDKNKHLNSAISHNYGAVQKIRNAGGVRGLRQFSLRSVTKN